jgi:REP element-mobilizing transposase RayT
MALGYLLTFGTYGTHLHGDDRGSWRARRGFEAPNAPLRLAHAASMKEAPFTLGEGARDVVLQAIVGLAKHRGWGLRAVHIRTEHVHVVVMLPPIVKPMKALADFKAYGTRGLREAGVVRERYWAERGHCVFLWTEDAVQAACVYVYEKQGEAMACYTRAIF